jgi:hypothetical protein
MLFKSKKSFATRVASRTYKLFESFELEHEKLFFNLKRETSFIKASLEGLLRLSPKSLRRLPSSFKRATNSKTSEDKKRYRSLFILRFFSYHSLFKG